MKPDSFPPTYKFKKLNLKKRGPPPLVNLIYSAENVEELKQLFAFKQGSYSTSQTDDHPKLPFLSTKKEEDCSKTESRI